MTPFGDLMAGLSTRLFWLSLIVAYWCCTFWILFNASPIFDDGYGLDASFYWGIDPPTSYPQFLYPYWIAASILTFVACGVSLWLVPRWKPRHPDLFLVSLAITLLSLLVVCAISDAGSVLHIWNGPVVYNTLIHGNVPSAWMTLKTLGTLSLFSGVLAVMRGS